MTTLIEGRHAAEFVLSEAPGAQSRENLVIGASQIIVPGQVLGAKAVPASVTATASADAANTASSGTIAMDGTTPVLSKAKNGRYIGVASAATKVNWEDPEGKAIGVSTHGSAFTGGGIKFTITAGGTPNVVGDKFYVDVGVESVDLQYSAFDPTATDGAEVAAAIALYGVTTGVGETAGISGIARLAEVNGKVLTWPAGVSAVDKASAIATLAKKHIIVR